MTSLVATEFLVACIEAAQLMHSAMQPGRQVGDVVWRSRVQALSGHQSQDTVIEAMWDLRKCFEHVQHQRLAQEAERWGFPLDVLRFSVLSYTWGRTLVQDSGVVAPQLYPRRGIVAGSAFAPFELNRLPSGRPACHTGGAPSAEPVDVR